MQQILHEVGRQSHLQLIEDTIVGNEIRWFLLVRKGRDKRWRSNERAGRQLRPKGLQRSQDESPDRYVEGDVERRLALPAPSVGRELTIL